MGCCSMLTVGFIGFGAFAQLRLSILEEIEGVKCIGFFDPHISVVGNHLKCFETRESLIDAADVIMVSVPLFLHLMRLRLH